MFTKDSQLVIITFITEVPEDKPRTQIILFDLQKGKQALDETTSV